MSNLIPIGRFAQITKPLPHHAEQKNETVR
jgi:hypothetical protein